MVGGRWLLINPVCVNQQTSVRTVACPNSWLRELYDLATELISWSRHGSNYCTLHDDYIQAGSYNKSLIKMRFVLLFESNGKLKCFFSLTSVDRDSEKHIYNSSLICKATKFNWITENKKHFRVTICLWLYENLRALNQALNVRFGGRNILRSDISVQKLDHKYNGNKIVAVKIKNRLTLLTANQTRASGWLISEPADDWLLTARVNNGVLPTMDLHNDKTDCRSSLQVATYCNEMFINITQSYAPLVNYKSKINYEYSVGHNVAGALNTCIVITRLAQGFSRLVTKLVTHLHNTQHNLRIVGIK